MHTGITSPSLTNLLDVAKYDRKAAMHDGSYFRLLEIGEGILARETDLAIGTVATSFPNGEARTTMECGGDGHILESNAGANLA